MITPKKSHEYHSSSVMVHIVKKYNLKTTLQNDYNLKAKITNINNILMNRFVKEEEGPI